MLTTLWLGGLAATLLAALAGRGSASRPSSSRGLAAGLALGVALAGLGVWGAAKLHAADHTKWAVAAAALGFLFLLDTVDRLVESWSRRSDPVFHWVFLVVACAAGAYVTSVRDAEERRQQAAFEHQVEQAAEDAASVIGAARTAWQPGPGVVEVADGRLIAWLAVPPTLTVDWEYETAADAAERRVPLRLVLLNDSFAELRLEPYEPSRALWSIEVVEAAVGGRSRWHSESTLDLRVLGPAERIDFPIGWNGRDDEGALLEPGAYIVRAQLARTPGGTAPLQAELALQIEDAGPIVEHSPAAQVAEQEAELYRLQRQIEIDRQWQQILDMQRRTDELLRSLH